MSDIVISKFNLTIELTSITRLVTCVVLPSKRMHFKAFTLHSRVKCSHALEWVVKCSNLKSPETKQNNFPILLGF